MIYNLLHRTVYEYTAPVTVSHHAARVEPRRLPQQTAERFASFSSECRPARAGPAVVCLQRGAAADAAGLGAHSADHLVKAAQIVGQGEAQWCIGDLRELLTRLGEA